MTGERFGVRSAGQLVATVGAKGTSAACGAMAALLVARSLTASGNGEFVLAMVWALMLVPLAQGALRSAVVTVVANEPSLTPDEVGGAAARVALVSAIVAASLGVGVVAASVGEGDRRWALLALLLLPSSSMASLAGARWWLAGRSSLPDMFVAALSVLRLAAVALAVALGVLTVGMAVTLYVATHLISSVAALYLSRPCIARCEGAVPAQAGRMVAAAALPTGLTILATAALLRADVLMLRRGGVESAEIGEYGVSLRILELAWIGSMAFGQVFLVDRGHQQRQSGARAQPRRELVGANAAAGFAIGAALTLAAYLAATEVLGASYGGLAPIMFIALPGIAAYATLPYLRSVLFLQSRQWSAFAAMVGAVVLNLQLNFLFIPPWGSAGAAAATSISYFVAATAFWLAGSRVGRSSGLG